MNPRVLAKFAAELAGTALLVGIGTGAIVWGAKNGGLPRWETALAWSVAVLLPIGAFVGVSGAHLNPAVTTALAVSGRLAWREVPLYLGAQIAGAFVASAAVLFVLGVGPDLGATVPGSTPVPLAFWMELGFSAVLIATVFLLADHGAGAHRWRLALPPAVVGVSTFLIGPFTGSSLNPARSMAPAVLSGNVADLWLYLLAAPLAALIVAALWKPTPADRSGSNPARSVSEK